MSAEQAGCMDARMYVYVHTGDGQCYMVHDGGFVKGSLTRDTAELLFRELTCIHTLTHAT